MVWPWCEFRMQVWNLLHAARWKYRTQKSPSGHYHTNLSGYIFATKAHIDDKNLLSSSMFSRCPHNMVNFGPLAAEIGSGVWGTPTNFNGFRILAALLHGGRQPNFAALNWGRHLYTAGRPSRWALAHILVCIVRLYLHFAVALFHIAWVVDNAKCTWSRAFVCLSVRSRMPTLLHGPGCNLGEW